MTATDGVGVVEAKMPATLLEVAEDWTSAWTTGVLPTTPGLRWPVVVCWRARSAATKFSRLIGAEALVTPRRA